MNYVDAIKCLERLNAFGIKPGLERISLLLERLGNPQSKFKSIHVAGTNGKGSVSAMLSTILSTAGIQVGLFTSPHLSSYRERFKFNGADIDEPRFAEAVARVQTIIDRIVEHGGESPTQFEALTAMAFDCFARAEVEYAVVEAGLGGLLDSTNVLNPIETIITNVGMDHADKCGGTLEGIAHHKAGIIKRGVPLITAARARPLEIIRSTADRLRAPIKILGENFFVDDSIELALEGTYQKENAAVAIEAARILDDARIDRNVIETALKEVKWAGRFERFSLDGETLVIDGAHNPDGARALRMSLDAYFPEQSRTFLFGVLADKDFDSMIEILFRPKDFVIVTRPNSSRAAEPNLIAERLSRRSIRSIPIENINDAFDRWLDVNDRSIKIAAGSLYMIGTIRDLILKL